MEQRKGVTGRSLEGAIPKKSRPLSHHFPALPALLEPLPLVYTDAYIRSSKQVASRFEWDENKNRANRAKHGISFEKAKLIFEDPNLITRQDREVEGEQRWLTIGYAEGILAVAHTAQETGAEEIIRIISARRATAGERKLYEKEELD
jgi:hypothetical protein